MGSKGSTTTQTQNQQQSQTYAPTGAGYLTSALDRATSAAAQPFAIPQAPVAGFSQDQQQAFQQYRDAQGMAQPYFNQAAGYYSPQGAQDFLNPYSANVMAGLKDIFGQQMSQTTGKLTQQAGGIGADRIAVGQAELAKQQGLTAGQTLSGMYDNAVRQAQAAGQGQMALGQAAQGSALQGASALYGAGQQQQQLEQQRLNAPYQQDLARAAFPYQQAQFLSGVTGSLAPGLGGTTSGYSNMTGSKTTPGPSLFSQILGGGTAAVGALGGSGAFGNSGWLTGSKGSGTGDGSWYGPSSLNGAPLSGYARGGFVNPYADGGMVDDVVSDDPIDISSRSIIPSIDQEAAKPIIPQLQFASMPQEQPSGSGSGGKGGGIGDIIGSVAKIAPFFLAGGGRVMSPYADGGEIDMETPATFDERFPYRMPDEGAMDAWRANAPSLDAAAEPVMAFAPEEAPTAPAARAVRVAGSSAPSSPPENPYSAAPAAPAIDVPERRDPGFAASPWAALVSAGLGMMAGTSPFAGVNIGQGGLQGIKTLEAQRAAAQKDTTIEQAARRLAIEAKHHEDQYTRMTPYQKAGLELRERELKNAVQNTSYLGPTPDGTGSVFLDKRTGKTRVEPIQIGNKPKPMPAGLQKDLGEKASTFNTLTSLEAGFKPDYAGHGFAVKGDLANWAARQFNLGNVDAADWWQQYSRYKNQVRHELFGAALTATETAQWEKSDINPGMAPERIEANIKRQREIVEGALRRRATALVKQGYGADVVEAETGVKLSEPPKEIEPSKAAAPSAAPKVGERKQFKQGWGRWDGKQWVPEQ